MVEIFRYTARGVDAPLNQRLWIEDAKASGSRVNGYVQGMVRREMRILQSEVMNIPRSKMDEIRHVLLGNESGDSGPCFDMTVELYV